MGAPTARTGIKWGVVLGVAVCLWTLLLHSLVLDTTRVGAGQRADVLATILPLAAVALALLERRRETSGPPPGGAPLTGLLVGLTPELISVPFMRWYPNVVNVRWLDLLVQWRAQRMAVAGNTTEESARAAEAPRRRGTDTAHAAAGVVGSALIAAVLSFVGWLVLQTRTRGGPGRVTG